MEKNSYWPLKYIDIKRLTYHFDFNQAVEAISNLNKSLKKLCETSELLKDDIVQLGLPDIVNQLYETVEQYIQFDCALLIKIANPVTDLISSSIVFILCANKISEHMIIILNKIKTTEQERVKYETLVIY